MSSAPFDLLRVPGLGRFLRWRRSRMVLQVPVLVVAIVMIAHAFFGPGLAPKNLATLLTWVHFRGLVVLVILLAGNLFCMACPFMLPRELARRFVGPRFRWPRRLRNKWVAVALFVGVLFCYELFDLWAEPVWTGTLIVGYFAAAIVVDSLFERASFCKYVCPIGQFNFVASTISPLEVAVRDPEVCRRCRTKDCIRGRPEPAAGALPVLGKGSRRGCELALFQPRKVDNLDCTFCLDCVYACPHDNVGIVARVPAEKLAVTGRRSGVGSLERRADFSALTVLFVFGALLNALAMVSPVYAVEQWAARQTGLTVEWPILGALFVVVLVVEPFLLVGGAALCTRWATGGSDRILALVHRYVRCLIPVGFGIWLAHYGFHFFTGVLTVVPVAQNALLDIGIGALGAPQWQLGGLPDSVVYPLELGFLGLGAVGSSLVAWRIASEHAPAARLRAFVPWFVLSLLLTAAAYWIMSQPMDMRGTFLGG